MKKIAIAFFAIAMFFGEYLSPAVTEAETTSAEAKSSWKPLGPFGGNIKAVISDGKGTLYIGTDGAGVFKSSDLGKNWTPVNNGLEQQPFITSMAMTSDGSLYAGTKEGVYKKEKGKSAWSFLENCPKNWIPAMVVDKSDTIFASVWGTGMYSSNDKGANWDNQSEGLAIPFISALVITPSGVLYGGSESGISQFDKHMKQWNHYGLVEEIITSITSDNKGTLFTGAWGNGVFRYDGKEWQNISAFLGTSFVKSLLLGKKGEIYAGTEVGIYQLLSDDKWENLGPEDNVIITMLNDAKGNFFAGSTGNGFYTRPAGSKTFETSNQGITNYNITKLTSMKEGDVVGTYFSLFTLNKEGVWNELERQIKNIRDFLHVDENTLLIASGLGIYKGNPYKPDTIKLTSGETANLSITSLAAAPGGIILAGSDQEGTYMSKDQGESWVPAKKNLTNNVVHALVTDKKGRVFAGTNIGVIQWMGEDQGWKNVSGALKNWSVKMLVPHPDGSMYAGVDRQGVYFKAEDSSDWEKISEGLTTKRMSTLAVAPDGTVYAGTQGGLFRWSAAKKSWTRIGKEIYNPIVQTLAFRDGGKILAGTWGGGLFRQE